MVLKSDYIRAVVVYMGISEMEDTDRSGEFDFYRDEFSRRFIIFSVLEFSLALFEEFFDWNIIRKIE